jgi:hypothetical protein
MQVDSNGNTVYSDIPSAQAKQLDISTGANKEHQPPAPKPVNTSVTKSATDEAVSEAVEKDDVKKPYTAFSISSPVEQDTFQNQRDIPVEIKIDPELQKGDTIQLMVDGQANGGAQASTHLQVHQLDRGTHQVYAVLFDGQKQLRESNRVTFYVHYAHVGS